MASGDDATRQTRRGAGTPAAVSPITINEALLDTATPPHGTEPERRLVPGMRIHQYELIRELGRGGMGQVYAARDTKLGRRVAMKFLLDASHDVAERFLVEARATAQCDHDNIVIIHEVNALGDMPYMVLEHLDGHPLREVMGHGRIPWSRVVELALPIARALARAHELKIVHRDLKPENVFLTSRGQVKVLDFGIAKALGAGRGRDSKPTMPLTESAILSDSGALLTKDGALVGTLPYMSPEQIGAETIDHRTDLWALGIILWEMLAGRHPIEPLTVHSLLGIAGTPDPMPSLRELDLDVPEELVALIEQCLKKPRDERMDTAAEVVQRLELLQPGKHGRTLAEGESPYPGLAAFQEADADRFFGRRRDIARMVTKIRELPLTGVIGPSGVGKSSFVRAGVGPALKASGEPWDVVTVRPGRQPLTALASILERLTTRSGGNRDARLAESDERLRRLRTEPGYLGTELRARARQSGRHLLLFIDQLEELYTLVADREERRLFTAALASVADDAASPLRVVISMRSDFLDRVAEDPTFAEELTRGLVLLAAPDREGLREALVQPLDMIGYRFETSAMVGDMLDALGNTAGALPLLQFTAAKLWDVRDRKQRMLTTSSYHSLGGISGALATHADEVIRSLPSTTQRLAQTVFRQLVTPERTRAIVEIADLEALGSDPGEVKRLIEQLAVARLLVVQTRGDSGTGSVELVHESLIDRWPMLRRWLDEDQEDAAYLAQIGAASKQWDSKGRPHGLLWRGEAMEEAKRWYGQRPRVLARRDEDFLADVFALARRGKRMRRFALIAAFAVLAVIAGGAIVATVSIRAAEKQAQTNATKAEDALARMQKEEAAQRAAEERKLAAERAQQQAVASQQAAEAQVVEKSKQVEMSQEQLKAEMEKLQVALHDAEAARAKAEAANARAAQSANEAQQANAKLKDALAKETARRQEAEAESAKLAKKLR